MKVIHPIEYYELKESEVPVFLAWPIRWTIDWHERAIEILWDTKDPIVVFSPKRMNWSKILTPWKEDWVDRQRQWEMYYLRNVVEKGGQVLFWLEQQKEGLPESHWIQKKSYWAISHMELGQRMVTHPDNIVVGIDPDYNERSTLVNDLRQNRYLDLSRPYNPKRLEVFTVSESLEDTCTRTKILLWI